MNNDNVEQLKEEFWEKIRPKSQQEKDNEEMLVKVRDHYDRLVDDLLKEDTLVNSSAKKSKLERFTQIKKEIDNFINLNYDR